MKESNVIALLSLARHTQRRRMDMQCDPQWVLDLATGRDALRAEVERLRQSLRSVIVAAGGSAAPDVSTEFLELAPLEVLALRGNLDQLQARLRRIEPIAECGSVQSWLALPDEAKAKWFGLHVEQDGERLRLRAEVETLREIREIASQCAANGGYLCSRDLIELRELLKK